MLDKFTPEYKTDKDLYRSLVFQTFWRVPRYDCEGKGDKVEDYVEEVDIWAVMYKELYWKMMSIIESVVDKDKIEPTKTLARQLFTSTLHKFEEMAFMQANKHFK